MEEGDCWHKREGEKKRGSLKIFFKMCVHRVKGQMNKPKLHTCITQVLPFYTARMSYVKIIQKIFKINI